MNVLSSCARSPGFILILIILFFDLIDPSTSAKVNPGHSQSDVRPQRQLLVFGGNGFIGASTVEGFIQRGDNVTIVNRGNWYWDSKERIKPHVNFISCDRKNNVTSCAELVDLVQKMESDKFDAVIDFSAYGPNEIKDAMVLLNGKASLYVYVSTDSIYDVCDVQHRAGSLKEEEAMRPNDPDRKQLLNSHHDYGHRKLMGEEELVKQRDSAVGIPYVILRLPDVIGPRDTTFRFWIYQLWVKLAARLPKQPVYIPKYLVDYNNSFVYVDDVARVIFDVTDESFDRDAVIDQAFNLAWPENVTLQKLLRDIEEELGLTEEQDFKIDDDSSSMYFYPSGRSGPIDSNRAVEKLGWKPTPWKKAIGDTVRFYEDAVSSERFRTQMNEIVQIQSIQLYPDDKMEFFDAMEKTYKVNLSHFRLHDEL